VSIKKLVRGQQREHPVLVPDYALSYYEKYKHFPLKAARLNARRYKSLGCLTVEDLAQEATIGFLQALRSPKFESHPNKPAFLFSYCSGYITHLLHRKSRMIKPSYESIKNGDRNFHISLEVIGEQDQGSQELDSEERISYGNELQNEIAREFLSSLSPGAQIAYEWKSKLTPATMRALPALKSLLLALEPEPSSTEKSYEN
jgi:DNA-directed RNA polymerase specialized sigma24 family protein